MKTFARIDGDLTFRHTLWHVLSGIFTVIDGLVSILTLGIVSSIFSVKFMQWKWATAIFDHMEGRAAITDIMSLLDGPGPPLGEVSEDDIKNALADQLGIDPKNIELVASSQSARSKTDDGVLVIPKNTDKTWH